MILYAPLVSKGFRQPLPLVIVDIGYSAKKKSCGLAWTGQRDSIQVLFGEAIEKVARQMAVLRESVLVIEAPLSTLHDRLGNPGIRGEFEKGRGWYCGPGAVTHLAARRFLEELARKLRADKQVLLAEAFLSNKSRRTSHSVDATTILRRFWGTKPKALYEGVEPVLGLVSGVPEVRVFRT